MVCGSDGGRVEGGLEEEGKGGLPILADANQWRRGELLY